MLHPGGNRRSTASSGWRSSGLRAAWCCSFAAPHSPDSRPLSRSPCKQPAAANLSAPKFTSTANSLHSSPSPSSKLGRGIIDPRRILSPGRVSPIDSDVPLVPLPERAGSFVAIEEQEIPYPLPSRGDFPCPSVEADSGACDHEKGLDLKLKVTGRNGRRLVMEMDSGVLCASSSYFASIVLKSRPKLSDTLNDCWEIEIEGVEDLDVFRETIEMMYDRDEMNWLMKAGVSRAIDVLEECGAPFVFFRTRYAAVVTSEILQSSNPMHWVTDLAPESHDVYWSNVWIPYRQLWFRKIAILVASIVFMVLFLIPVTFVQGLTHLDQLQQIFPFLDGLLKKKFTIEIVSGYLPSVILQLFLYIVPPVMLLFSSVEGSISHSARKRSACWKVLYFNIWNVFFVNVFSGSLISQINAISSPKDIPTELAKAVPSQATFFITYVLTSGWASLSSEVMQLFGLIWNFIKRHILRWKDDPVSVPSFPYHTEIPRVLLFGLLGFTCSILAPLILPFLLVYFFLGYVVYRNQILNVYCSKYETGGQMWPIAHNATIFSLVLAQIIAIGVFGIKESPSSSSSTIPLVILTLLFNEYCRQRFYPIFKKYSAQDLIEMDSEDERSGRLDEILEHLHSAYCQFPDDTTEFCVPGENSVVTSQVAGESSSTSKDIVKKSGVLHSTSGGLPVSRLKEAVASISLLITIMNSQT